MTFDELKEKAHALPLKPGVYIMQDAKNEVIYVGKAKALKNRVSQYFANLASHTEKTRAMVSQIDHFDVIVADSEFEALILENSLIKRHQPHYNILLKDDKGYPYIRLTVKEPYPRFSLANRAAEDGARYFGPYGSRGSTQNIIDALRVALKLPSCSRKFPRDIGKERPCLNYHMGQCDGYCRKEMDQTRYREAIDQAVRLLEGQFKEVGEELLAEMEQAAEELRFEKAAELRDRFKAIELLGKDVAMIHFKDFLRKDADGQLAATGAGQGGMCDYRTILRFAKQEKPWVFATLENTTPENSVQCLQYLQKQYDAC